MSRRRTHHVAEAERRSAKTTNSPSSVHRRVPYRLAGWYTTTWYTWKLAMHARLVTRIEGGRRRASRSAGGVVAFVGWREPGK